MTKSLALISLFFTLTASFNTLAAPKIDLNMRAELEITVKEDGKDVIKRIEAKEVEPGQEVIYTLTYVNSGDEGAFNVKLNNQIPVNTTYKAGSAWGDNAAIEFSIDDGQSFKQPALLVYQTTNADGETIEHKASPEKYTHLRWIVKEIPADSKGEVGFRITVN